MKKQNIRVSLFIDPKKEEINAAANIGTDIVEFHTGRYSEAKDDIKQIELSNLAKAAKIADYFGIEVHAGHGLDFSNVSKIASIKQIKELNIGHFLIGEAIFSGLGNVIQEMRSIINSTRKIY